MVITPLSGTLPFHSLSSVSRQAGRRISEPVRAYSLEVGQPAQAKPAEKTRPPEPKTRSARAPLAVGTTVLIAVIALVAWYFFLANRSATVPTSAPAPVAANRGAPVEAARLSLVVLPFANLSNDPSQDYFADGITENLTTDLSRIRGSFVIARNTAFTFKGKNIDAKQIGKELGVRYVLEGSVQRDQGRVRVNAQLIDAASGAHLWAAASKRTSRTCSSCRMWWWPDWRTAWAMN